MNYNRIVFTLLMFVAFLRATNIEMIGITQYLLTTEGVKYSIASQKRVINSRKIKKSILNIIRHKKVFASNSSYYINGIFRNRGDIIRFKKAYWLEGVFHMEECSGKLPKYSFTAKEVNFYRDGYRFKTIRYKKDKKIYIKHNYRLLF